MRLRISRALLVAVIFLGIALPASAQTDAAQDFTVIVLPDTQFYSQSYPHIFNAQTQWIADNREALNIQFVVGVGDIVNDGSSLAQWQNADAAISTLDAAGVPYVLPPGNHDYKWSKPSTRDLANFNSYFGTARYADRGWWQGSFPEGTNDNSYSVFNIVGTEYLVLALELYPRDMALAWAASVIEANPEKKVILTTHSYLFNDSFRVGRCDWSNAEAFQVGADNDGDEIWERLASRYSNVFLVLSGHIHGTGRRADAGAAGNHVVQILADYQHEAEGGGGYLRILKFRPALNVIEVSTYSPYRDAYRTDAANQFTVPLTNPEAGATTGTVAGEVRSASTCEAVSGATVTSDGASGATNTAGRYSLSLPVTESASITAQKSGWQSVTGTAPVNGGYSSSLKFFLDAATTSGCSAAGSGVTICTPSDGATVGQPVRITAASSGARYMQVWVDGAKAFHQDGAQLDASLNLALGKRRLVVTAVDVAGTVWKKTIYVTVVEGTPCAASGTGVIICSPADGGTSSSPVAVQAAAASSTVIRYMQAWVDGTKMWHQDGALLNASLAMASGTRRIVVTAVDQAGAVHKKTVYVTVN